jgi:6-pyruvoyltetrahydropterin/6-carboxytetrahydropterin synthase
MTASVTRRYRFSASHRLHTAVLSDEENSRVFGKCNNPYGHGHDYELEVTVHGAVDPRTGLVTPVSELDRYVEARVLTRFANRNINLDVPEFEQLVPTTENMALVMTRLLGSEWPLGGEPDACVLTRVHLQETGRNGFEIVLGRTAKVDNKQPAKQEVALR